MIELIIGREKGAEEGCARLAVTLNNETHHLGKPGCVPHNVSRDHCRVVVGDDDKMTVENLKYKTAKPGDKVNPVYVDGVEVVRKDGLPLDALITLGPKPTSPKPTQTKFRVSEVLVGLAPTMEYPIDHLKEMYEDYMNSKTNVQIRERKLNAISALPIILTMGSAIWAANPDAPKNTRLVMGCIAFLCALAFAVIRYVFAGKVPKKTLERENRFRNEFVCPSCHSYLSGYTYDQLAAMGRCPHCKCKFVVPDSKK